MALQALFPELTKIVEKAAAIKQKEETQTILPASDKKDPIAPMGVKFTIDTQWLWVQMPQNTADIARIKQIKYASWSPKEKAWRVPLYKNNLKVLENWFEGRISEWKVTDAPAEKGKDSSDKEKPRPQGIIYPINQPYLAQAEQEMVLKGMSMNTRRTYQHELGRFLADIKQVNATDFTHDRLRNYLAWCLETVGLSENTIHSRMNAMKFLYEQVLKREKFFYEIPRPKRPFLLPKLLNEDELGRLFAALENKKHKAILFTVYSSGLRVSEVVNLKIADIDSGRMQIHIRHAKGKKDRYVNLSPLLLDILRAYLKSHKPKPKEFLFESDQSGTAYPTRTVQQIFTNAKAKARILKEVGIHSLRHSFATHLLDKGTDIRYIKELLGHFNIKTTERYLHVSKQQLVNIVSPLDDLFKKGKISLDGNEDAKK